MADTNRRVPLWLIATVGGLAVFSIAAVFIYGSYSGLGSSW
jgi:photosystem II PsbJ protein